MLLVVGCLLFVVGCLLVLTNRPLRKLGFRLDRVRISDYLSEMNDDEGLMTTDP